MTTPDAVVVLCTAPDEATAQDLAAKALADKLAACATLLPGATSLYYWEGKLEQEYEVQMLLKTDLAHQQALLDCLSLTTRIKPLNCWFCPSFMETTITSHGLPHHYADPAAVQHVSHRRVIRRAGALELRAC